MKQLEIKLSLSEYNEKHSIYIGQNERIEHFSKKFLETYLRTFKKVMLDNVRILNNLNAQLYTHYRTFFFDLSDNDVRQITDDFESFNRNFNWMFDNIGGNTNSIIFNKISKCVDNCFGVLLIMKNHGQLHKNYAMKNQTQYLLKMLSDFETRFNDEKLSLDLDRDYTKDNLRLIKNELKKTS